MSASSLALPPCDLAAIKTDQAVHEALSRRAVEVIGLLAVPGVRSEARLASLIAPFASFDLGSGDVGRPLGQGVAGARALATEMNADSFQFYGWDYMSGPASACTAQKVTVEFLSTADRQASKVEFTFDKGRITSAKGWSRSLERGSLPYRSILLGR
jgi:hypothetical protein